jgi:hypothetical protein
LLNIVKKATNKQLKTDTNSWLCSYLANYSQLFLAA